MTAQLSPSQAGNSEAGTTIDRRAWVRMPSGIDVCCQPMATSGTDISETGWLAKVRDVSAGGISMILRRRFEPGTVLILDLEQGPRQLSVRVVHVQPEMKGRWLIGCAFSSVLTPEELECFLLIPERPFENPVRLQLPANC